MEPKFTAKKVEQPESGSDAKSVVLKPSGVNGRVSRIKIK
jgi:hypothetical protein